MPPNSHNQKEIPYLPCLDDPMFLRPPVPVVEAELAAARQTLERLQNKKLLKQQIRETQFAIECLKSHIEVGSFPRKSHLPFLLTDETRRLALRRVLMHHEMDIYRDPNKTMQSVPLSAPSLSENKNEPTSIRPTELAQRRKPCWIDCLKRSDDDRKPSPEPMSEAEA